MDDDVDVRPDTIATIKKLFTASDLAMIAGINEGEKFIRRNSPLGLFFCRSSHKTDSSAMSQELSTADSPYV